MPSGRKIPEKKCREMEKWETDGNFDGKDSMCNKDGSFYRRLGAANEGIDGFLQVFILSWSIREHIYI